MSEASSIAKLVIILGVVFLLIGLIFPGQDAAWNSFRTSLSVGPSLPTFDNPFNGQSTSTLLSYDFIPIHPSQAAPGATSTAFTGCFGSEAWTCVQDLNGTDGNTSYATLPNPVLDSSNSIWMDLSPSVRGRTISVQYDLWCRYSGPVDSGAVLVPTLWKWNGSANVGIELNLFEISACGTGFFSHVSGVSDTCNEGAGGCGEVDSKLYDTPFSLQIASIGTYSTNPWTIDISTARVSITIGVVNADTTVTCGGDVITQLGCKIGQFGNFLFKLGQFIVNGIVFVIVFVGSLISFVLRIVGGLLIGLVATFTWFLAIPGAPPIVQILMASIFVGVIAYILYVILKIFTGMIGGINPV